MVCHDITGILVSLGKGLHVFQAEGKGSPSFAARTLSQLELQPSPVEESIGKDVAASMYVSFESFQISWLLTVSTTGISVSTHYLIESFVVALICCYYTVDRWRRHSKFSRMLLYHFTLIVL